MDLLFCIHCGRNTPHEIIQRYVDEAKPEECSLDLEPADAEIKIFKRCESCSWEEEARQ